MRVLALLCLAVAVATPAGARVQGHSRGFQIRVGAYAIESGQELEVCEYRRLPNAKPLDVSGFKLRMPAGAHHFALWSFAGDTKDDSEFPRKPVESVGCGGVAPGSGFPQLLIPTQSPEVDLAFPEGIAIRLEPHQQVWLNPHMKNFASRSIRPDIRLKFLRAKKGTVQHYAEGLTFGNMLGIHIPAGGDQTLTAEWTSPIDLTIVHLSTHQHRLGTYARIDLVAPDGGTREKVVESFDWEHPTSVWPPGGLRLAKGQKMRITCTWHNTDDHDIEFGPKTTDEMCFGIGFFYRDPGDTTRVVGSGCLPSRKGLLCPLAPVATD